MTDIEALKAEAAALVQEGQNLKLTTESLPEAKALLHRVDDFIERAKVLADERALERLRTEVDPLTAGVRTFIENWDQLVPFWTRFAEIHHEMRVLAQGPPRYAEAQALIGEAVALIRQYQPLLPDPGGLDEAVAQFTRWASSLPSEPDGDAAGGSKDAATEAADEAHA